MSKIIGRWSHKQTCEEVLYVISSICSISIIIFVCTQILGIWKAGANLFVPLLGVSILIQAIQNWKKNRKLAIAGLYASILFLGFSIFIFVLK